MEKYNNTEIIQEIILFMVYNCITFVEVFGIEFYLLSQYTLLIWAL